MSHADIPTSRCEACGVDRQQVLRTFNERQAELVELVKRAAPFVNAVAVMAEDRGPALAWLADASAYGTTGPK